MIKSREQKGESQQLQEWWKSAVVYQIYPRSFADSNGDGVGDLRGIINHLDHFVDLGIDVLWLSPIYSSPHDDNGYDISDYQSIDPVFGTLDDFDELVKEIHARGMKIVMDLVVNHTSDKHPWFIESSSSTTNPKRDWYWWKPPRKGFIGGTPGAEPTNWGSFFSGPTWKFDESTGEYFLHLFSSTQPDLNWENQDLRQAIYSMMRWWLDRGVDGFRMDVINLISKDQALPDGDLSPGTPFGNGFPHYSYGPRIHEFLSEMHAEVFSQSGRELITIGEMPGVTVEQARRFTDPQRRELNMVFQFEHVGLDHGPTGKWEASPFSLPALKGSFARWQEGLSEIGWNSLYWNNHDQPRAVSRFGNDEMFWAESAKLLAGVLHLQRGTPFIYQGEEIGMTNVPFSDISDFRDIETLNYFAESKALLKNDVEFMPELQRASRDNARTPMQWSPDKNAGFSNGEAWIGINPNYRLINASTQTDVKGSIYEFYRELIHLRHSETTITYGDFQMLSRYHPKLFAFTRSYEQTRLLVLANFSDVDLDIPNEIEIDVENWSSAALLLGNYPSTDAGILVTLRPWELKIYKAG